MSARTSAELIEGYVGRLAAELTSVGAAEVDDLVAEVRSLLVDAAGDDPERAATEIAKFGEPAELAAGILAERGLTASGGIPTADWWRMGIAVPIDIAIGVSVPIAAALPAYLMLFEMRPPSEGLALPWPSALAVIATFLASLGWPWYVWRPWRVGGSYATAGMSLTGISVVRAPGFHQVVRSRDLAGLGLASPRRGRTSGLVTLAVALALLAFLGSIAAARIWPNTDPLGLDAFMGPEPEQVHGVASVVEDMYADLEPGGEATLRIPAYVAANASCAYESLAALERSEKVTSRDIGTPTKSAQGVWSVVVTEKTPRGARVTVFTVGRRAIFLDVGAQWDWVITGIASDALEGST